MRNVLVHYHLFKNAGSSIDRNLKSSFGDSWYAFDPPSPSGLYSAKELYEIISQHKDVVAFSSHCIVPPLLKKSIFIHPIIVLREPISRVMSAYLFEWKKQKNLERACGTLADYIYKKFESPRKNAIENFQTSRLAVTDCTKIRPAGSISDTELVQLACNFLDELPVYGLVENLDESMQRIQKVYSAKFPKLKLEPVRANATQIAGRSMSERHEEIKNLIGVELFKQLILRNQLDIQLYSYAVGRFNAVSV